MKEGIVTLGETMALMTPQRTGRIGQSGDFTLGIGGAESNVAIGVARLGGRASWIGRIGNDSLGEFVSREIRAEGVDVHAIRDEQASTGLMVKERRTEAASNVLYYRAGSAGSRLAPEDIPEKVIEASRVLHLTGITLALSESARAAATHAALIARNAGVVVSFDLNYRSRLWSAEVAGEAYASLLPLVDILFAGPDEAAIVPGVDRIAGQEQAGRLAAFGPTHVLIKNGADGAIGLVDGELFHQDAVAITPMDTVGAGDAFVAGYLADYLLDETPSQALRTATAAGAFACLSSGDWEGSPSRDELGLLNPQGDPVRR